MAASTLSSCAETALCREVPPAQVPALKKSAFDLMTRSASIVQGSADRSLSTTRRDTPWIGKSVEPLRSDVRPNTAITPALRPGHKVGPVLGAVPSRQGRGSERIRGVDGAAEGYAVARRKSAPAPWRIMPLSGGATSQPRTPCRTATGCSDGTLWV